MSPQFVRCGECRTINEAHSLFCSRCGATLYGRSPSGSLHRRRRVTVVGALKAFALLLILAATVFTLYAVIQKGLATEEEVDPYAGISGTTATLPDESSGGSGSGQTSPSEASTLVRPTSVDASSTLDSTSTNSYRPTNLVDGDFATAWNEGAEGLGLGEWVKFEFSRQLVLTRIEIANGFQKDDDRFAGNPRVKTLKVEYSTGTVQLVDLLDASGFQTILPTRQPVEWVKMAIVSVHPDYEWEDTALSEVRIYARTDR